MDYVGIKTIPCWVNLLKVSSVVRKCWKFINKQTSFNLSYITNKYSPSPRMAIFLKEPNRQWGRLMGQKMSKIRIHHKYNSLYTKSCMLKSAVEAVLSTVKSLTKREIPFPPAKFLSDYTKVEFQDSSGFYSVTQQDTVVRSRLRTLFPELFI